MKHPLVLLLLLSFLSIGFGLAQKNFALLDGQTSVIYSLPKTELIIEIETEKSVQKPGQFFQHSERYLATNKIIKEEKTSYRFKSIQLQTRPLPDSLHTYNFPINKFAHPISISVNAQGLLCGINVKTVVAPLQEPLVKILNKEMNQSGSLLPLGEEYMMAGSEAKLAEGAAKQIYHLRESRINLLTGELERTPADGNSLTTMLDGLDKRERELTELFIGKTTVETQKQKIYLTPKTALNNQVLFRLSTLRGIVAADDLSGVPFYISIKPNNISVVSPETKPKKLDTVLYTLLPSTTWISINDGHSTLFSDQFQLPQFGKTIPLDQELLEQKGLKIQVDTATGRVVTIETM